jgi:hypothetical protein
MRKIVFLLFGILAVTQNQEIFGQGMAVNSSGTAADGSAMLDVSSTTQGVLVPRMTASQRGLIGSPATGLLVYQTDGSSGFYFYNGSSWTSLNAPSGSAGGDLTGTYPSPTIATNAVTSTKIADGTIVNADINSAAAIDYGKITGGPTSLPPNGTAGGNLGGTYPNPSIASLPAISGASLTNLNGSNISSGTVGTARLGSGTASSSTFLRGDGTWNAPFTLTTTGSGAATFSGGTLNIPTPSGGGSSSPTTELIAYHSAGTTLSPTTNVLVTFGTTVTSPTIGSFDGTTYTAGATGYYAITVTIVNGSSTLTALGVTITAGGTIYYGPAGTASANQTPQSRTGYSILVPIASGGTVTVNTFNFAQSNTGTLSTDGKTRITIVKI